MLFTQSDPGAPFEHVLSIQISRARSHQGSPHKSGLVWTKRSSSGVVASLDRLAQAGSSR